MVYKDLLVRVYSKKWNFEHSEMLTMLNCLSLEGGRKVAEVSMMFKIVNNLIICPEAPEWLWPVNGAYSTRHSSAPLIILQVSCSHFQFCTYSYFPHTLSLWNSLPHDNMYIYLPKSVFLNNHKILYSCSCIVIIPFLFDAHFSYLFIAR